MGERLMSATIKDVARLAGVSKSTVSRVLSDSGKYSQEAKEKVLRAAKELNYTSNAIARAMVTKQTGNIGFLIHHKHEAVLSHPFYSPLLSAVVETATIYNHGILVFTDRDVQKCINNFQEQRVDGVILASHITRDTLEHLNSANIPVVLVNHSVDDQNTSYVMNDDYGGAYEAVYYLLKQGHRRIGLICDPDEHQRFKAYKEALKNYGIAFDESLIFLTDSKVEQGKQGVRYFLKQRRLPSAIFATNDMTAIEVIKELKANGYRVPNDVGVVGFDDIEFASLYEPALTTVKVDKALIGELAVRQLLRQINRVPNEDNTIEDITLPASLVVREST